MAQMAWDGHIGFLQQCGGTTDLYMSWFLPPPPFGAYLAITLTLITLTTIRKSSDSLTCTDVGCTDVYMELYG